MRPHGPPRCLLCAHPIRNSPTRGGLRHLLHTGASLPTTLISSREFGEFPVYRSSPAGTPITLYTLASPSFLESGGQRGLCVSVSDLGATVQSILVPDRDGELADVVLGFDSGEDYLRPQPYLGCTVGRCATPLDRGAFSLDGVTHELERNMPFPDEGVSHALHGGLEGWSWRLWRKVSDTSHSMADPWQQNNSSLLFRLISEDGDEGYPGTVEATARFEVTDDDELLVTMTAETLDHPTVVNMCNHSYFNLSGHASGDILNHKVQIPAEFYTPSDATGLPTGEIATVEGTALDLRSAEGTALSVPIEALTAQHAAGEEAAAGLDHNFVLCDAQQSDDDENESKNILAGGPRTQRLAAVCTDPVSQVSKRI
jgi:aldose 1-epimerase